MVAKKGKREARKVKNLQRKSVGEKQAKGVKGGIIVVCDQTSQHAVKTIPWSIPQGPPDFKQ